MPPSPPVTRYTPPGRSQVRTLGAGSSISGSKRCTHRPPSRRTTSGSRLLPVKLANQAIRQKRFRLGSWPAARPRRVPNMMRLASRAATRGRHPSRRTFRGAPRFRREAPRSRCRSRSAGPDRPRMSTPATGTAGCRNFGPPLVPRRQGRRRWRSRRTAWASEPAPRGGQHAPAPRLAFAVPPSVWNSRRRGPDRS